MKRRQGHCVWLFFVSLMTATLLTAVSASAVKGATWGKTYHGPWGEWWTSTTIRDFIVTADGGFAAVGTSNSHGVVVKLASDGALTWSTVFSPGFEESTTELAGIVETADGGFAVTGQAYVDSEKGGHGDWDAYVVRLDSSGALMWERLFGRVKASTDSFAHAYGRRIYENADGTLTVTGVVLFGNIGKDCPYYGYESGLVLNIGADGALLSHYVVSGSPYGGPKNEVYKTSDGGYIVASTRFFDTAYTLNIQKFNATAEVEWTRGYYGGSGGTAQYFHEHSVAEVEDGYIVATNTADNGQYHLFKTDPMGVVVWEKRYKIYADGSPAYPIQIVETNDGGTIVSLRSGYSTIDDVLLKTDSSGNLQWANYYGGHYMAIARSVGDGFAVATSEWDFLFARLNGTGYLDNRCAALPTSPNATTEEEAAPMVVIPGKGDLSCNEAVAAGTWTGTLPDPGLLTGLSYRQVDACVPKLTVNPSPVSFYDTKVGLSSALGVTLSNYSGLGDIHINGLSLSDTLNFALQADGCSGQTISYVNFPPYYNNCTLQVVFTPKSKGLKVATLSISSDYPEALSSVEVRGSGYLTTYALNVYVTPSGKGSVAVDPPGTTFDEGMIVTLTAQPGTGYRFDHWEGSLTGSANPMQVAMTGSKSVTAVFAAETRRLTVTTSGSGNGTVTSSPPGISCGTDCTGDYVLGTTVTLTPAAASGSEFAYWTGACVGEMPTCTVVMSDVRTVGAVFVPQKTKQYKLTVTKVKTAKGEGMVVSGDGTINCGKDCAETYFPGAPVVLTALANPDSVFAGWSGTGISCPGTGACTVTMDKAYTVKATFIGPSTLKVQKTAKNKGAGVVTSSDGKISCGPTCQGSYLYNSTVTLTATPDPLSVFSSWTGCDSASGNTCTVTATKAKTVKATFTGPWTLKVAVASKNKGMGTVASTPPGISCPGECSKLYMEGASVILTATPDPLSVFSSWTGCDSASGNTCTVAMTKVRNVRVMFDRPKTMAGEDTMEVFGEEGGREAEQGRPNNGA